MFRWCTLLEYITYQNKLFRNKGPRFRLSSLKLTFPEILAMLYL